MWTGRGPMWAWVGARLDDHLGFLTPILKGFLTEVGLESANLGIQIWGGACCMCAHVCAGTDHMHARAWEMSNRGRGWEMSMGGHGGTCMAGHGKWATHGQGTDTSAKMRWSRLCVTLGSRQYGRVQLASRCPTAAAFNGIFGLSCLMSAVWAPESRPARPESSPRQGIYRTKPPPPSTPPLARY